MSAQQQHFSEVDIMPKASVLKQLIVASGRVQADVALEGGHLGVEDVQNRKRAR